MSIDLLVIGLGYFGLALAREGVLSGLTVEGLDLNDEIVAGLNSGKSHVGDITDEDIQHMLVAGFRATSDKSTVPLPTTIVICVPIPLSASDRPDLAAVCSAAETAGSLIQPGALVVIGTTAYLGSTAEAVRAILETRSGLKAGKDFFLAFSTERMDPGNDQYGARNMPTPRVRSGLHRRRRAFGAGVAGSARCRF